MNSHPEQLDEELERMRRRASNTRQHDRSAIDAPEVKVLAALAHSLQGAPPLQVDPDFADHLERRLLARYAALQRQRSAQHWWGATFLRSLRTHPALASALSLCLVVILLGTGLLVVAMQVTNPNNPLYALGHREQQVQVSLAGSSADQAKLDLQTARDQLNALPSLADFAHGEQYRQTLTNFDQQLNNAAQTINTLPVGQVHTRLAGDLVTLQADARVTLRGLLLQLAVPEQQATTEELGRLGDTVPHLAHVDVTLPARPNGQASISISGDDLQAGAQLLVDGRLVTATSLLQNGSYLFTLNWRGDQHPHTIGIRNPDGTVAQTTAITLHTSSDNNGNNNGGGNGNGNGGGKPESTPTPHH